MTDDGTTFRSDRPGDPLPAGMREGVPEERLLSRELKVFGDVEVGRHRFYPGETSYPPLQGHLVNLHLGAPTRVVTRRDGGRWEGTQPTGTVEVFSAGLEKFQRWTDESGEKAPDEIFGMGRLLTAVMIYLVTESFGSSIWAYPGVYLDPPTLEPGQRVEAPTAVLSCADPLVPVPPRTFVERAYNVARWTEMPEAGHFAAFQQPQPVREDLQEFLSSLREGR